MERRFWLLGAPKGRQAAGRQAGKQTGGNKKKERRRKEEKEREGRKLDAYNKYLSS